MKVGYQHFRWLKFKTTMMGFRWSSDWRCRKPWTCDGEPRPYFGLVNEGSSEMLRMYGLYLGPALIITAWKVSA